MTSDTLFDLNFSQNLFPVQIENVLTAHPFIREAAAVAVPDTKFGEVVGAWIVLEPGKAMSKEDVQQVVRGNMNPQVRLLFLYYVYAHKGALDCARVGVVRGHGGAAQDCERQSDEAHSSTVECRDDRGKVKSGVTHNKIFNI